MALSWGKCRLLYKNSGDTKWNELPTPAEGTTNLSTTQGTKTEAKVEGGENEDVKYGRNTYTLNANVRMTANRTPIPNEDGFVKDEYSIVLQPEDKDAVGLYLERASVAVQDSYTSADGAIWAYTFDALKPEKDTTNLTTRQVREGIVTIAESEGSITGVTFKELGKTQAATL